MALSNTAIPKYYSQFKAKVLAQQIPICKEIEMEMNRIDELIRNKGIWYDDEAVEGFIRFCENELTLTDGSDLYLLDTFKLWAEQIFGWYYYETKDVPIQKTDSNGRPYIVYEKKRILKRLINKMYLIISRGAAKSMFLSCIQNYFLNIDTTTTHQITTAPTMKQAEEVMSPIRTSIIRSRGPYFKFLTYGSLQNTTGSKADRCKLAATKKGIENFITGSLLEVRPMSIDRLQGLRTKLATVDEWLSGDIREDVIGAIEQGASKIKDYLIIAASSEGTARNGVGDTIKMELMNILKGKYVNPHVSIWYYKIDSLDEVDKPEMWIKANPNIGLTVDWSVYHQEVEKMYNVPSSVNDILAKRFGWPMEGLTYFFTYEETLPFSKQDFWKMPCSMGVDLSQGNDFTAFTFLFPLNNGGFGVKTLCYISSLTLGKLQTAARTKYEEFIDEGSLRILDGAILDMQEVYDDLQEYIEDQKFDVCCVGYDPYGAKEFMERWSKENGPYGIEQVRQGKQTESIPLGELKNLASERMLYFDQKIMSYTMGNCIVEEDNNGQRKLMKRRYEEKIDSVSALLDAFVAYKLHKDNF